MDDELKTITVDDLVTGQQKNCHRFYCTCERSNKRIFFHICGSYMDLFAVNEALIKVILDDMDSAMDELDRLNQLLGLVNGEKE